MRRLLLLILIVQSTSFGWILPGCRREHRKDPSGIQLDRKDTFATFSGELLRSHTILWSSTEENAEEQPEPSLPARTDGNGEWADWEGTSYMEDEIFDDDDGDDEVKDVDAVRSGSFLAEFQKLNTAYSKTQSVDKGAGAVVTDLFKSTSADASAMKENNSGDNIARRSSSKNADEWLGWSEEPPYFDEDDVQDDEGNWGRADESKTKATMTVNRPAQGTSSLWERVPLADREAAAETTAATSVSGISDQIDLQNIIKRLDAIEKKLNDLSGVPHQRLMPTTVDNNLLTTIIKCLETIEKKLSDPPAVQNLRLMPINVDNSLLLSFMTVVWVLTFDYISKSK